MTGALQALAAFVLFASVCGAYARGAGRRRAHGARSPSRPELAAFVAGVAIAIAVTSPPVDDAADRSFALHMTQHVTLLVLAAPLVLFGRPGLVVAELLPPSVRRAGARLRRAFGRDGAGERRRAALAFVVSTAIVWAWHAPAPFDAALRSAPIHAAEHASLFAAGLIAWAPVVALGRSRRLVAIALALVLAGGLQSAALGALLTFSREPWYPTYAAASGAAAVRDQQLAGLVMWIVAGFAYLAAATWVIAAWLFEAERRERAAAERRAALMPTAAGTERERAWIA
jgi:putative membrane protein